MITTTKFRDVPISALLKRKCPIGEKSAGLWEAARTKPVKINTQLRTLDKKYCGGPYWGVLPEECDKFTDHGWPGTIICAHMIEID
jgi:hypothetical protein